MDMPAANCHRLRGGGYRYVVSHLCLSVGDDDEDDEHVDWKSTANERLTRALETPLNTAVARNVIVLLGDGMGVATVTAGRIYAAQKHGRRHGEESSLAFEHFPHVGLAKVNEPRTHCPPPFCIFPRQR